MYCGIGLSLWTVPMCRMIVTVLHPMFWGGVGVLLSCTDRVEAKGGWDMILTVPMEVAISFYRLIPNMNNWLTGTVDGTSGCSQSFSFSGLVFGIQPPLEPISRNGLVRLGLNYFNSRKKIKPVLSTLNNSRVGGWRFLHILSIEHLFLCGADY